MLEAIGKFFSSWLSPKREPKNRTKSNKNVNILANRHTARQANTNLTTVEQVRLIVPERFSRERNATSANLEKQINRIINDRNKRQQSTYSVDKRKVTLNLKMSQNMNINNKVVLLDQLKKNAPKANQLTFHRNSGSLQISLPRTSGVKLKPEFVDHLLQLDQEEWTETKLLSWSQKNRYRSDITTIAELATYHDWTLQNEVLKVTEIWKTHSKLILTVIRFIQQSGNSSIVKQIYPNPSQNKSTLDRLKFFIRKSVELYLQEESAMWSHKQKTKVSGLFSHNIVPGKFQVRVCAIPPKWKNQYKRIRNLNNNNEIVDENDLFRTLGSLRFPHKTLGECPFTNNHSVWVYTFRSKKRSDKEYSDSWIQTLARYSNFTENIIDHHENIKYGFGKLLTYYAQEIRLNKKNNSSDIRKLAMECYDICIACKLDYHPMFRICAGFEALDKEDSEFIQYLRFFIHNGVSKNNSKNSIDASDAKLTKNDVKYFFLSSDLLPPEASKTKTPFANRTLVNSNNSMCKASFQIEDLESQSVSNHTLQVYAWPSLAESYRRYA
tara:strand:- start:837 stop:2495 length:1659 start_codon:yes stop_codon:yes gene_type:complete